MRILLASSNEHKRHEFSQLFAPHEILLPKDLGIRFDCEENGSTFQENAMIKARALFDVAHNLGYPVMADDSGLIVPALTKILSGSPCVGSGQRIGSPSERAIRKNLFLTVGAP